MVRSLLDGSRAVLWDLDGVLADTSELHYESWWEVLPHFGLKMTWEQHLATFGRNNAAILAYLTREARDPAWVEEVSQAKEEAFRRLARKRAKALPGAKAWLERLQAWGIRQAVASSAPLENVDTLVEALGMRPYLDALVSGERLPAKPDPAIYLEAARRLGIDPRHCLVVEDAIVGVEGARRAGMRSLAVTTTHDAKALSGADLIVGSLEDVAEDRMRKLLGLLPASEGS